MSARVASAAQRMQLGPGAAMASWLTLLIVLNATVNPGVALGAFCGGAATAWHAGHRRLIVIALLVGAGLVLVIPGVAVVDGSWSFTRVDGAGASPSFDAAGIIGVAGALVRVPAQIVAIVALLLVPADALIGGLGRLSPRSGVFAALSLRMVPMLRHDAMQHRDELASRGYRFDAQAPLGVRLRSWLGVWNALICGAFDRACTTAASLETRGFGGARPTAGTLALLRAGGRDEQRLRRRSWVVASLAGAVLCGIVIARATGAVPGPSVGMLAGANEPITGWTMLLGVACALLAAIPVLMITHPERATQPLRSSDPRFVSRAGGAGRASGVGGIASLARTTGSGIELDGVRVRWPDDDRIALNIESLRLEPGALLVVAGASGSGKSTLLQVVSGLIPFSVGGDVDGCITIDGSRVDDQPAHRRHGRIAMLFQDPDHQVIVGTVAEEVAFGLRHRGVALDEIDARVDDALRQMHCLHLAQRDSHTLSGGELQRVMLAAALAARPRLLLLDEPTAALDHAGELSFWDAVEHLRTLIDTTVVVCEHRLQRVMRLADRVIVLEEGRIVVDVAPNAVAERNPELLASPFEHLAPYRVADAAAPCMTIDRVNVRVGDSALEARAVVRDVSLQLRPGSIVTLEGPNGVGKSSLLRAVCGLDARGAGQTSGRVVVDGRDLHGATDGVLYRAYVSQQAGPLMHRDTVLDEAADISRRIAGLSDDVAVSALAAARLDELLDRHPADLSVGQRQRLAIVAATAHRPRVWLLDEPTRGMDPHARRWFATWVIAHAANGGVALVATHDAALASAIATHRLMLDPAAGARLMQVVRNDDGNPESIPQAAPRASSRSRDRSRERSHDTRREDGGWPS